MECFGVVSGRTVQSQNFGTVFGQSETGFSDCFGLCVLFFCVIAGKMNNMLVM